MIDHFDFYRQLGWEVVPLLPNSKLPFLSGWNEKYDEKRFRDVLVDNPKLNIGLRLGEIVDVEADSDRGNTVLSNLTKTIPHPTYQSNKSIHHLFQAPNKSLTRVVINDIEFRGSRHQSVLPPSVVNGIVYQWLDTCDFQIPAMPTALLGLLKSREQKTMSFKHIQPWCSICKQKSRPIHTKRYTIEVTAFKDLGLLWQCHSCRNIDVRTICRKVTVF